MVEAGVLPDVNRQDGKQQQEERLPTVAEHLENLAVALPDANQLEEKNHLVAKAEAAREEEDAHTEIHAELTKVVR